MALGGSRVVVAMLLFMTFGIGCDGEDVEVDIFDDPTPGAIETATPPGSTPIRTQAPAATPTPGTRTATPAGPTPTAGAGPTATADAGPTATVDGSATATPGGPTATGPTPTSATPTSTGPTPTGPTATATPGAVDADVQAVVRDVLPFFTVAGLTTGVGTTTGTQRAAHAPPRGIGVATQAAVTMDACPDGGTRTQDDQLTTVTVTLAACKFTDAQLGSFQFDGTITASLAAQTASINVTVQDLIDTRTVTFTGSVTGTPASGGGFVIDGGPITITTPEGDFTLTLDGLTVDGDGNVIAGGGTITDDDDLFELQQIVFTIRTGGLLADLVATFDDTSTTNFVVDLRTGAITPAT
jgi:hypothetical protein